MLLEWNAAPARAAGVAMLFGTGLVGGAVAASIVRIAGATVRHMPWTWVSREITEVSNLERATLAALGERPGGHLAVIWAAGNSGFHSDAAGMATEAEALGAVLATARRLVCHAPKTRTALHFVSSAGGLFEGQVASGPNAAPRPLRPYGHGKLEQEQIVAAAEDLGQCRIYRPSSVYGYTSGGRLGLIPALMTAALQGRPARILGTLTTQRDYVYRADVGRYIATTVLDIGSDKLTTSLLAQGRPATIYEILQLVEERIGVPVMRALDPRPANARDTTFLRTALPLGFCPTPLVEGVARTAASLMQGRGVGAP